MRKSSQHYTVCCKWKLFWHKLKSISNYSFGCWILYAVQILCTIHIFPVMGAANVLCSLQFVCEALLIFAIVNDRSSLTLMNGIELWSTAILYVLNFSSFLFDSFHICNNDAFYGQADAFALICMRTLQIEIAWHIMKYTVGIFSKYEL